MKDNLETEQQNSPCEENNEGGNRFTTDENESDSLNVVQIINNLKNGQEYSEPKELSLFEKIQVIYRRFEAENGKGAFKTFIQKLLLNSIGFGVGAVFIPKLAHYIDSLH